MWVPATSWTMTRVSFRKSDGKTFQPVPEPGSVCALFFLRFGAEEIVYNGDDGIAFFHQRNVCRVR
jgi:hypothetical protein